MINPMNGCLTLHQSGVQNVGMVSVVFPLLSFIDGAEMEFHLMQEKRNIWSFPNPRGNDKGGRNSLTFHN